MYRCSLATIFCPPVGTFLGGESQLPMIDRGIDDHNGSPFTCGKDSGCTLERRESKPSDSY